MQRIRYEIDPYNRFAVRGTGKKTDLPKFRRVFDGRFKTDQDNNIYYEIKDPLAKEDDIPNQIRLKGEWSLTRDHDLRLTLDKSQRETFGDALTFRGEILDAKANSLLFEITTINKANTLSTYVLNLDGLWKADENNRLSFHIRKESGRYDILTFNGAWDIDKNFQIVYRYEKAELIKRKRASHALTFKGYWDVKEKLRLSYVLSGETGSGFDFGVSAGVFTENYIKYEVGIGLSGRVKPFSRSAKLTGKWNLKKGVGLVFEIEYRDKEAGKAIVFGADARLTAKDTITFRLKGGPKGEDLGAELELSRKILKGDGEAFLRIAASRKESAVYAGAAWRW